MHKSSHFKLPSCLTICQEEATTRVKRFIQRSEWFISLFRQINIAYTRYFHGNTSVLKIYYSSLWSIAVLLLLTKSKLASIVVSWDFERLIFQFCSEICAWAGMFHELCYNIFRCHCDRLDGTEFVFNENVGRPEHLEKRQYLLLNHDIKDKVVSLLFFVTFLCWTS